MIRSYFILLCFLFVKQTQAQTLLAYQGFDGSATWSFTANPTRYNCFPEDTWADTTRLGDITSAFKGNKFWGINDLDNSTCGGGSFYHLLTFPSVNVTAYPSVYIRFKYFTSGFDANDLIGYMVQYNNSGTWGSINQLPKNSQKWDSVTVNVPSGTTNVQFRIVAQQNGSDDFAGVDDIELVGASSDIFPPYVLGAKELSASQIRVRFSERVSQATATNASNYTGLGTISSVTLNNNGDTALVNLASPLTLGNYYTLTIQNLADGAGNLMAAPFTKQVIFNNTVAKLRISEIMYNPPDTAPLEFIEIYNAGTTTATLGGYKVVDGFQFQFPTGTLDAGKYLVLAANAQAFASFFNTSALQWESGSLTNNGEKITIENSEGMGIDSVTYADVLPWDTLADGGGHSLVVCYPQNSDNHLPQSWTRALDYKGKWNGIDSIFANPGSGCFPVSVKTVYQADIHIYPNPAGSVVNVSVPFAGAYIIRVFDLMGKSIVQMPVSGGSYELPVQQLTNGNYWLVIATPDEHMLISKPLCISR